MFNLMNKILVTLLIALFVFVSTESLAKTYKSSSSRSSFSSRSVSKPSTSSPSRPSYSSSRPSYSSQRSAPVATTKYKSTTTQSTSSGSSYLSNKQQSQQSAKAYATINTPKPTTTPKPYTSNSSSNYKAKPVTSSYSSNTNTSTAYKPKTTTSYGSTKPSNTTVIVRDSGFDVGDALIGAAVVSAFNGNANANTNANNSAEVAKLKQEVEVLKQQAVAQPPIDRSKLPTINFCAGQTSQNYHNYAVNLHDKATKYNINVIETNGSTDNLARMSKGECDATIVQRDVLMSNLSTLPGVHRIKSPYGDEAMLMCRVDLGVNYITELKPEHKLALPPTNSGSYSTWSVLAAEFGVKPTLIQTANVRDEMFKLKNGDVDCAFMVTTKSANIFNIGNTIELHKHANLVHIPSKPLDDLRDVKDNPLYYSHSLYTTDTFQYKGYATIFGSRLFRSSADTVIIPNDVVITQKLIDNNSAISDALISDVDHLKL